MDCLVSWDGCTETIRPIPDMDEPSGQEGTELSKTLIVLKSGDWFLKIVPWIGGRIISMTHVPSGMLLWCYMINGLLLFCHVCVSTVVGYVVC